MCKSCVPIIRAVGCEALVFSERAGALTTQVEVGLPVQRRAGILEGDGSRQAIKQNDEERVGDRDCGMGGFREDQEERPAQTPRQTKWGGC